MGSYVLDTFPPVLYLHSAFCQSYRAHPLYNLALKHVNWFCYHQLGNLLANFRSTFHEASGGGFRPDFTFLRNIMTYKRVVLAVKSTRREKSTEKVRNISGQQFGHTSRTEGSTCSCSLWYFEKSRMSTTAENMYRHSILSPYSNFCPFTLPNLIIFSSVVLERMACQL